MVTLVALPSKNGKEFANLSVNQNTRIPKKKVGTLWLMQYSLMDRSLIHETTRRRPRTIAADSRTMAQPEQRGAEQATMALDSLYNACKQNRAANSGLRSAIAGLFVQVQNPSASNVPAFVGQLQKTGDALARGGAQAGK
jgi:hypothetical protein